MRVDLFDHIARFVDLSLEQKDLVSGFLTVQKLKRREHLFRADDHPSPLSFVTSGCLRLYSVNEKGAERTLQFGLEGWWLADWNSFRRGLPTGFSLQAIEDSEVVTISRDHHEALLRTVVPMERYFRSVYERIIDTAFQQRHEGETSSAEELYRRFQSEHPEVLQRVPQYMLASCLGFTPEFLSMIRARKSKSGVLS